MALIGVPHRRLEGGAKVTGATRFTADLRPPGLTFARLLLSPFPAARIARLDLEAARRGRPSYFEEHFKRLRLRSLREYNQSHKPVREQREVVGHAVRAMYL